MVDAWLNAFLDIIIGFMSWIWNFELIEEYNITLGNTIIYFGIIFLFLKFVFGIIYNPSDKTIDNVKFRSEKKSIKIGGIK